MLLKMIIVDTLAIAARQPANGMEPLSTESLRQPCRKHRRHRV
jgi:hypothetical protein